MKEPLKNSFICANCYVVYTFGTTDGSTVTAPPCCLSCGSEDIHPTDLDGNSDLTGIDPKEHIL